MRRGPEAHIHGDQVILPARRRVVVAVPDGQPCAIIPAWFAAWLLQSTDLRQVRRRVRGDDIGVDDALAKLAYVAAADPTLDTDPLTGLGAVDGTTLAAAQGDDRSLEAFLEARAAGDLLRVSERTIRRACAENRLRHRRIGGRILIHPDDLSDYRPRRGAA